MAEPDFTNFTHQVRELEHGESASRTKRFSMDEAAHEDLNKVLLDMRRTINTAASRMRTETGNEYVVESGIMLNFEKDAVLAVVAVTRF